MMNAQITVRSKSTPIGRLLMVARQGIWIFTRVLRRPRRYAGSPDRTLVAALHAIFARVRWVVHQVKNVPDARTEHDEVDQYEGEQRERDSWRIERTGSVGGAHQVVDDEWLTPNFGGRSEEHTSELQSLMRISYAVFCLKKTKPYK